MIYDFLLNDFKTFRRKRDFADYNRGTIFIYLVLYHEKVVLATRRTATNIKLFRFENWLVKELNYATVIKIGCDIIHRGF